MGRPPTPRFRTGKRTSFARRDSNLALLGALLAGVVLAFALLLLVAQRANPQFASGLRGATADALLPVITIASAPINAGRAVGDRVRAHLGVVARNRELMQEVARLRARASRADQYASDARALSKLLLLHRPERRLVASAIASANAANGASRTAIISAGRAEGVRPRMPVIAADGVAGRVTDVGEHAARLLLLTDPDSRVPVKVLRTGWTGLAVGTGSTLLDFQFDIASGTDHIRRGDRLVTSGDGGLFPPGLPVAVIIDTGVNPPRARPLANPTGLGPVSIEAPWLPPPAWVAAPPAIGEADRAASKAPAAAPATPATPAAPRAGVPTTTKPANAAPVVAPRAAPAAPGAQP